MGATGCTFVFSKNGAKYMYFLWALSTMMICDIKKIKMAAIVGGHS